MWLQLQKLLLVLIWSCRGYLDEKPRTRPILAFPWVFLTMVVYAGFPCSIVQLYNNIARCNLIDTKYRQMVFRSPSDGAPISPIQRWFRDFYSQFECRPSLNYSTFLKSWCTIICQSCIMLLRVQLGHPDVQSTYHTATDFSRVHLKTWTSAFEHGNLALVSLSVLPWELHAPPRPSFTI